jgi:hypothetical protein
VPLHRSSLPGHVCRQRNSAAWPSPQRPVDPKQPFHRVRRAGCCRDLASTADNPYGSAKLRPVLATAGPVSVAFLNSTLRRVTHGCSVHCRACGTVASSPWTARVAEPVTWSGQAPLAAPRASLTQRAGLGRPPGRGAGRQDQLVAYATRDRDPVPGRVHGLAAGSWSGPLKEAKVDVSLLITSKSPDERHRLVAHQFPSVGPKGIESITKRLHFLNLSFWIPPLRDVPLLEMILPRSHQADRFYSIRIYVNGSRRLPRHPAAVSSPRERRKGPPREIRFIRSRSRRHRRPDHRCRSRSPSPALSHRLGRSHCRPRSRRHWRLARRRRCSSDRIAAPVSCRSL